MKTLDNEKGPGKAGRGNDVQTLPRGGVRVKEILAELAEIVDAEERVLRRIRVAKRRLLRLAARRKALAVELAEGAQ